MPAPEAAQSLFSTLLLAGGRSARMGRDKALLPHPVSGRPLLEHQAALLRTLPGCAELLLSAPPERGYALDGPLAGARLVADVAPDCGPLAGLAAGLAVATTTRLLVLAVDLPFITPEFLSRLLAAGVAAPRHANGTFEPLCAVYPVAEESRAAATAAIALRELSLQRLLGAACGSGWIRALPISAADRPFFANWNTQEDVDIAHFPFPDTCP